jgi:lysophospholipase L1-like esterase
VTITVIAVATLGVSYHFTHKKPLTQTATPKAKTLVALGDSVAAGVGLFEPSDSSACDRSNEAYPKLLASQQNYKLTFLACSGASIAKGLTGEQTVGGASLPAQLDSLTSDTPNLITLTIGANDIDWVAHITKCIVGTCGTASDSQQVSDSISLFRTDLETALEKIETRYQTRPQVIVTGYYHLYPTSNDQCAVKSNLEDSELSWIAVQTDALNSAIKEVVSHHDSDTYMAPDFSGHLLCGADPWVQDISERTPYHPNEDGQIAIAQQITKSIVKD